MRRKLYNHLIYTDFMGIASKIKQFKKARRKRKNEKI
tara:strand:+ start:36 stop:146 length:111 start_codon:yes stop_codon:yes gene_type:complete